MFIRIIAALAFFLGASGCNKGAVLYWMDTETENESPDSSSAESRGSDGISDTSSDAAPDAGKATDADGGNPKDVDASDGSDSDTARSGTDGTELDSERDAGRADTDTMDADTDTDTKEILTCNGEVFLIPINGSGDMVCAGALAERLFRFGLCTCNDVTVFGELRINSFDSSDAMFDGFDDYGGALGVNGELFVSDRLYVGGTAVLAREEGVSLAGEAQINGDVKIGGDVQFREALSVSRDAYIGGDLVNVGPVDIGRDLYLAGEIYDADGLTVAGDITSISVAVPLPCPCAAEDLLDVSGIVEAARADNDNAENGVSADALSFVIGTEILSLDCGRYYLDRIGGTGRIAIYVHGSTALFVGEDVDLLGDLDLMLDEEAELDLFVAGDLQLSGFSDTWDMTKPSSVRFYVAGEGDVSLTNITGFNLYAPRAQVSISERNYGSIFAGDLFSTDDTIIHYDRDVLNAGDRCGDDDFGDGDECTPTGGSCEADDACCEPLVCTQDRCQPLVVLI